MSTNNTSKTYNAGDVADAHLVAESDMQWMSTAITHVKKETRRLHDLAKNGEILSQYHFSELIMHLEMYGYLADDRRHYHADEAKAHEDEWEANKKAVSL